jgi:hypothetical protein
MMSSLTRFDFLKASAYARCPSTTIGGLERLRWRNVFLCWYRARLLWGYHWLSPCWILPTWRIRVGHAPNLRQENLVRSLLQQNKQAKHTNGHYSQLGLLESSSTQSNETLPPPPPSSPSPPQSELEKQNKDTKTDTRGLSVHTQLWIGSPSCTVHSKRGIDSVRNGTEIRGICCCWTPVCWNSSTTI